MRKKETRHVRGIVDDLLQQLGAGKAKKGNAVKDAWSQAVGKKINDHAHPVNFRNKNLTVIVDNSTWLYKLTIEKRDILQKFNEAYEGRKKAEDIRFRVGSFNE